MPADVAKQTPGCSLTLNRWGNTMSPGDYDAKPAGGETMIREGTVESSPNNQPEADTDPVGGPGGRVPGEGFASPDGAV